MYSIEHFHLHRPPIQPSRLCHQPAGILSNTSPICPSNPPPMSTTSAGRNHGSRPVAIIPPNAPSPISRPSVVPRTWLIGNYAKPWMLPGFWPAMSFPPHGHPPSIGRASRITPDLWSLITGRSRVKRFQCGLRYQRCALLLQTSRSMQKLSSNKSSMTSSAPSA